MLVGEHWLTACELIALFIKNFFPSHIFSTTLLLGYLIFSLYKNKGVCLFPSVAHGK